jgi:hypothetical protein
MRLLWKPRLRLWGLLALIAGLAVLLAFIRPTTQVIDAANATRIATDQLFLDVAKDHSESPKILYLTMMAPGSRSSYQTDGALLAKPCDAGNRWWVVIGFVVGKKTTGKGYYTIATDGAVINNGLSTDTSP